MIPRKPTMDIGGNVFHMLTQKKTIKYLETTLSLESFDSRELSQVRQKSKTKIAPKNKSNKNLPLAEIHS